MVRQLVLLDCSQKQKWLYDSYMTKAQSNMNDKSQKLKNLQTLHTVQIAGQVEECPYKVAGLI